MVEHWPIMYQARSSIARDTQKGEVYDNLSITTNQAAMYQSVSLRNRITTQELHFSSPRSNCYSELYIKNSLSLPYSFPTYSHLCPACYLISAYAPHTGGTLLYAFFSTVFLKVFPQSLHNTAAACSHCCAKPLCEMLQLVHLFSIQGT